MLFIFFDNINALTVHIQPTKINSTQVKTITLLYKLKFLTDNNLSIKNSLIKPDLADNKYLIKDIQLLNSDGQISFTKEINRKIRFIQIYNLFLPLGHSKFIKFEIYDNNYVPMTSKKNNVRIQILFLIISLLLILNAIFIVFIKMFDCIFNLKLFYNEKFKYILYACILFFWLSTLPRFTNIEDGLDPSWKAYFSTAFTHKFIFGRDIVFTFGMFSQIVTWQYSPYYLYFFLLSGLLTAFSYYLVIKLLNVNYSFIFLLFSSLIFGVIGYGDVFYIFTIFLISLYILNNEISKQERCLITVAIVLISFIKFSYVVVILVPIIIMLFKRRFIDIVMMLILYYLFWICLQDATYVDIINFFKYSHQIANGYNLGMQNFTLSPYDFNNIFVIILSILFLLSGITFYLINRNTLNAILVYFFSFVIYKESIVRADGHILVGASFITLIGLFALLYNKFKLKFIISYIILSIFLLFIPFLLFSMFLSGKGIEMQYLPTLTLNSSKLALEERKNQLEIQKNYLFPKLKGCSDLYPYDLSALIASGNNLCVRPVLQSYSAYTQDLLKLNLDFLNKKGPDNIFWNISPIDNRYPTLDDSISWPMVFANYKLEQMLPNDYLLLKRKENNFYYYRQLNYIKNINVSQKVDIEKYSGLLWVKLDIKPTLIEKLISILYKPNQLNLRVYYSDGTNADYRLITKIAEAGFIISPTISNTSDFACIYTNNNDFDNCGKKVKYFSIETPQNKFQSMYTISNIMISSLEFESNLSYNKNWVTPIKLKQLNKTGNNLKFNVDNIDTNNNSLRLSGWGIFTDQKLNADFKTFIILKSNNSNQIFKTEVVYRPDVAEYYNDDKLKYSGFKVSIPLSLIKPGKYDIDLYISNDKNSGVAELMKNYYINFK